MNLFSPVAGLPTFGAAAEAACVAEGLPTASTYSPLSRSYTFSLSPGGRLIGRDGTGGKGREDEVFGASVLEDRLLDLKKKRRILPGQTW